jgi:hypothetical protein
MSELDVREQMRDVARPVLYLRVRDDRLVPVSAADEILALNRDTALTTSAGRTCCFRRNPANASRVSGNSNVGFGWRT